MSYRLKPAHDHLPKRLHPCDVYFIKGEDSGSIKIGLTGNIKQRLRLLRTNTPERLSLILVLHGPRMLEKRLHFHFRHLNIRGEWFKPAPELLAFIDARARYGWSLAEQYKWMAEVGNAESTQLIKEAQEWVENKTGKGKLCPIL